MRITVDTNILISATFWNGSSNMILLMSEAQKLRLFLSKEIIQEYTAVLEYKEIQEKIKNKKLEMKQTVQKIISFSNIVIPKEKVNIVKDDPDDNMILECALEGQVDFVISNDKHLLKLKKFRNIPIVSSDQFLKIYKSQFN